MDLTRTDRAHPAPVPVNDGATALTEFWDQSWGKKVDPVTTILGTEAAPWAPTDRTRRPDPHVREELERIRPGGRVPTGSLDTAQRLAIAGSCVVAVRRVVAGDRYVLHRAYPSPRALFGVDLEVGHPDGTRELCLPWDGSLATLPKSSPGGAALTARVRPGRYPEPYGTLRPSLARLEAGHLLATAGVTAHHLGVPVDTHLGGSGDLAGRVRPPGHRHPTTVPADRLAPLVRMACEAAPEHLDEWFARRTSGPSTANLVTALEVPRDVRVRLDAHVVAGLAAVHDLCPPGALVVHRTTLRGRGMHDRRVATLTPAGAQESTPLTAAAPWSSALGYTWSIDPRAWESADGSVTSGAIHVLLGWLCQWVCLAAAGLGVAARPARNIDEGSWAHDLRLPPESVPAYQVWLRPMDPTDLIPAAWTTYGRNA